MTLELGKGRKTNKYLPAVVDSTAGAEKENQIVRSLKKCGKDVVITEEDQKKKQT